MMESTVVLDVASVRALQLICLRLERLAAGTTAQHGRATEQSLVLLSLPIKDNADQNDLNLIAESYVTRIEVTFTLYNCIARVIFVDECVVANGLCPLFVLGNNRMRSLSYTWPRRATL